MTTSLLVDEVVWPGSIPEAMDPYEAMCLLVSKVGPYIKQLPWETYPAWIVRELKLLAAHPDVEVVREGRWTGYDDMTRYRVEGEFRSELINVGIVDAWTTGIDGFRKLRDEFNYPDTTPFELGVKSPLNFGLFAFGPRKVLAYNLHVRPFVEATVREMATVMQLAAKARVPVTFQLEAPGELIGECMIPGPLRPVFAGLIVRSLLEVARGAPHGCRIGAHTCPGRWYNKAKVVPKSAAPLTALVSGLDQRWPSNAAGPLVYVHLPCGAGDLPPSSDPRWYQPLEKLRVHPQLTLVAGILHPNLGAAEARVILQIIRACIARAQPHSLGSRLAIGPTCGSGQMSPDDFRKVLDLASMLCTGDPDFVFEGFPG